MLNITCILVHKNMCVCVVAGKPLPSLVFRTKPHSPMPWQQPSVKLTQRSPRQWIGP